MEYILLALSVILPTAILSFKKNAFSEKFLELCSTFTGAFIIGVLFLHLIPEVFLSSNNPLDIGYFIIGGIFFQMLLEFYTNGIEHGHHHNEQKSGKGISLMLFISLFAHTFLECLPIKSSSEHLICPLGHSHHTGISSAYFISIALHTIPMAAVLYLYIIKSGIKKHLAIMIMGLFALSGPLGVLTGEYSNFFAQYYYQTLALVCGILMHVSSVMLFNGGETFKSRVKQIIIVISGILLAVLITR